MLEPQKQEDRKNGYQIMHKDDVVAIWKNNRLTIVDSAKIPLALTANNNADEWLASRAMDEHRTNSRLLRKALRIPPYDNIGAAWHSHGATITDNYWVCPIGSPLRYSDVRFDSDYFADLALHGDSRIFAIASVSQSLRTPELTNGGSYEKCWRIIDGPWYMEKAANPYTQFAEVFIARLCKEAGISAAEYTVDQNAVRTQDFTNGASFDFEPASSLIPMDSDMAIDYEAMYRISHSVCPAADAAFVQMLYVDAVCQNADRHPENWGWMRNPDTGVCESFAPLYDHNVALCYGGHLAGVQNDVLIADFCDFIAQHDELKQYVPHFTEDMINASVSDLIVPFSTAEVKQCILGRQELIETMVDLRPPRDDIELE